MASEPQERDEWQLTIGEAHRLLERNMAALYVWQEAATRPDGDLEALRRHATMFRDTLTDSLDTANSIVLALHPPEPVAAPEPAATASQAAPAASHVSPCHSSCSFIHSFF